MEYYINNEKCYFCGHVGLVHTHEHWRFCPNCMAIYTFMLVLESGCEHVKQGIPVVANAPVYKEARKKPYIMEFYSTQVCSICQEFCNADGW